MRRHLAVVSVAASLVACAVLVVAPAASAAKGGNSANAKRCQKGGYQDWVRADQTPFKNVGQCVSYAARGGTLTQPVAPMDRAFCAPAGPLAFGQCSVPGFLDFDFEASSGPLGENPTGTFVFESLPFHYEGDVTCLELTGNVARIGGVITASNDVLAPVGSGWSFRVTDNAPDALSGITPSASPPTANTPGCGSVSGFTLNVTGDLVVEDN